jgi:hypothetical protein
MSEVRSRKSDTAREYPLTSPSLRRWPNTARLEGSKKDSNSLNSLGHQQLSGMKRWWSRRNGSREARCRTISIQTAARAGEALFEPRQVLLIGHTPSDYKSDAGGGQDIRQLVTDGHNVGAGEEQCPALFGRGVQDERAGIARVGKRGSGPMHQNVIVEDQGSHGVSNLGPRCLAGVGLANRQTGRGDSLPSTWV